MAISFANLILILLLVMILFGAGKLPQVMKDLGLGLKNFKDAIAEKKPEEITNQNKE